MVDTSEIRCFGFSYREVEDIAQEWNPDSIVEYYGGTVNVKLSDEEVKYSFAKVLNRVRPELGIAPDALVIYCDIGYIYPSKEAEVLVVDGVQE